MRGCLRAHTNMVAQPKPGRSQRVGRTHRGVAARGIGGERGRGEQVGVRRLLPRAGAACPGLQGNERQGCDRALP